MYKIHLVQFIVSEQHIGYRPRRRLDYLLRNYLPISKFLFI